MSDSAPTAPADDDCGCGHCLCHGAVVGEPVDVPALNQETVLLAFVLVNVPAITDGFAVNRVTPRPSLPPLAGRTLRILTQSFLI